MGPKVKPTPEVRRGASPRPFMERRWVAPTVLVFLTALVYARSMAVPIHDWDDRVLFFRDARLEHLSADNLWRIFTEPFYASFHPLTTLTMAFDRLVWGTWVPGFHVTQLAFYAGGILGLYFLFLRVLGRRAEAFVAAAIYATHTIHVESVAWLASRKDVVCLFFYAFALLAYGQYAGSTNGRWRPYALCLLLTVAALLSKGYALILPVVFFAYDLCFSPRITLRHILDKAPFVALAAVATFLTIQAQESSSALVQASLTVGERVMRLAEVLARYGAHTLFPIRLSAFYPTGLEPAVVPIALLGALLALVLAAAFVVLRRRVPVAAFGIALFVLPLATVLNGVFTLSAWMADRWLFFPTIGSSLTIVALAASLYRKRERVKGVIASRATGRRLAVMGALLIALYSTLTIARIGVWTSGIKLWSDTVRKQLHLGGSGPLTASELSRARTRRLVDRGPVVSLSRAYEAEGNVVEAGRISSLLSRKEEAGEEHGEMRLAREDFAARRYDEVLRRLKPVAEGKSWLAPLAMFRMGVAEEWMGNAEASRKTYQRAIEMYRDRSQPATDAFLEVGTEEFVRRNFPKAAEWFRLAYRESPREATAPFFLGLCMEEMRSPSDALPLYQKIAAGDMIIAPDSQFTILDVYLQMGLVAQKLGRLKEAMDYFQEVLRRAPNHPQRQGILAQIAALRAASAR